MAKVSKGNSKFATMRRVSPLKPGLRGSQNWMAAKVRAAKHSPKAMMRFLIRVIGTFLVLIFIALWLGGFLPAIKKNTNDWKIERLMAMGFVVEQVDVMGEGRLNERDIRTAVQINRGSYFFGVDLEAARARTESLPWVDRAVVRRLWPNRIVVQVVETTPYALWQDEGQLHLLSDSGEAIVPVSQVASVPTGLKTYVGKAAPAEVKTIEALIQPHDGIWTRVESLVRFPSGRWDLHMKNATVVRLPETEIETALSRLVALDRETFILSREVGTIDMRLKDRIGLLAKPEAEAQSS
ncbi:cell division protein FtsQ/DivIB [Litorimonas sp. WD9-15]|uniref:cell division protein FtsQ/DivIB n=1 Tax=Litorimonas sp. WD9-15 TaxID=3418716 RepID=UPI003D083185